MSKDNDGAGTSESKVSVGCAQWSCGVNTGVTEAGTTTSFIRNIHIITNLARLGHPGPKEGVPRGGRPGLHHHPSTSEPCPHGVHHLLQRVSLGTALTCGSQTQTWAIPSW
jgi:hypothetical protein